VTNEAVRAKFEAAWGVPLPPDNGLTLTETINKAHEGQIKALVVIGENPMMSDPDLHHVEEALEKLDFLVVQDIFLTETARYADVVLPGVTFAEKDGTFTNTERRVQRVRKAIDPLDGARPDWQIICELATRLGYPMHYSSPEEIFEEMKALTPSYARNELCPSGRQGTAVGRVLPQITREPRSCTRTANSRGAKELSALLNSKSPGKLPDEEYPLILTTGRSLFHYHTGTMTRRSSALDQHVPDGRVGGQSGIWRQRWVFRTEKRSDCPPAGEVWRLRPKSPTSWQRMSSLQLSISTKRQLTG
jgi:formate dehydrogenase major subunit